MKKKTIKTIAQMKFNRENDTESTRKLGIEEMKFFFFENVFMGDTYMSLLKGILT